MINICKGCGGSSSPSNPLILPNEETREGEKDGGGGLCIWVRG